MYPQVSAVQEQPVLNKVTGGRVNVTSKSIGKFSFLSRRQPIGNSVRSLSAILYLMQYASILLSKAVRIRAAGAY